MHSKTNLTLYLFVLLEQKTESPVCARLTLTGKFIPLEENSEEYTFARQALFERHSTMANWPTDHEWIIAKIDIQDIWLIDFFGGATILKPEEYFGSGISDNHDTGQ